jgi:hypothetical protein
MRRFSFPRACGRALRGGLRRIFVPAKFRCRHPAAPLVTMLSPVMLRVLSSLFVVTLGIMPLVARGDCSLTTTGNTPLPDLGTGTYQGFTGGLYPSGADTRPSQHESAGLAMANQIKRLDAAHRPRSKRSTGICHRRLASAGKLHGDSDR